jgi:hypothetical protein
LQGPIAGYGLFALRIIIAGPYEAGKEETFDKKIIE